MNQGNRDKVMEYLKSARVKSDAIYFRSYKVDINHHFDEDLHSLDEMIISVITLAESCSSYNAESRGFETDSGCRRSSLDIWRHLKYFLPKVEIFDVMKSLYKMYGTHDMLRGSFCNRILRRVFRLNDNQFENYMIANALAANGHNSDEYGLNWRDWGNI